jgi:hypothetical protein
MLNRIVLIGTAGAGHRGGRSAHGLVACCSPLRTVLHETGNTYDSSQTVQAMRIADGGQVAWLIARKPTVAALSDVWISSAFDA